MLGSFRRGVKSMRILSNAGVPGMVRYHYGFELPPCVIMDYVDGPNLEEAVQSRLLNTWHDILYTSLEITKIVRSGHNLPERVLHRDIRPPNIILKNFYSDKNEGYSVTVLDFDLSWHRGASEQSI